MLDNQTLQWTGPAGDRPYVMRLVQLRSSRAARWRRAHPVLSVFLAGLLVRLVGLFLIWAANGHSSLASKIVVVVGVILSIFGIGILKWLSFQPRRRSTPNAVLPPPSPPAA